MPRAPPRQTLPAVQRGPRGLEESPWEPWVSEAKGEGATGADMARPRGRHASSSASPGHGKGSRPLRTCREMPSGKRTLTTAWSLAGPRPLAARRSRISRVISVLSCSRLRSAALNASFSSAPVRSKNQPGTSASADCGSSTRVFRGLGAAGSAGATPPDAACRAPSCCRCTAGGCCCCGGGDTAAGCLGAWLSSRAC